MLRKIFSFLAPKKAEEVEITLKELERDFRLKSSHYHQNVVVPKFKSIISKLEENKKQVEELSSNLENAVLKNQKITIRERQFMEGNRESYVKHARILMRHDLPSDFDNIAKNYEEFMKSLEVFGSQTLRPKQILSHFFEHETESIHLAIYSIKKEYDKLLLLTQDEVNKAIVRLDTSLNKYSNLMAKRKELKESIAEEKKNISDLESENTKLAADVKKELDSTEYKSFFIKSEEKSILESAIKSMDESIVQTFSPVMRALKKYERSAMDNRDCITAILSSPKNALLNFDSEQILVILNNMKSAIELSRLEFNDEKEKIKSLKGIETLAGGKIIENLQSKLLEKISALKSVEESLKSNFSKSKLESLHEMRFIVDKKLSDHKSLLANLKSEFDSLDEEFMRNEIAGDYGIIIQKHVKII